MKNILHYGDSNTWGFVPGALDPETMYVERLCKRYSLAEKMTEIIKEQ